MEKIINIKTSWKEITVREYIIIKNILESEFFEEDQKVEKLILALTDLSESDLNSLKVNEYAKIVNALKFIKNTPNTKVINTTLSIKDRKFDVDTKLGEVVTGQYLMLQNIMKSDSSFDDRLKQVLGVFIRPKGVKWGDYDFEENSEFLYNNLSIEIGYSLAVFFSIIASKLLKATQLYLQKESQTKISMKKLMK